MDLSIGVSRHVQRQVGQRVAPLTGVVVSISDLHLGLSFDNEPLGSVAPRRRLSSWRRHWDDRVDSSGSAVGPRAVAPGRFASTQAECIVWSMRACTLPIVTSGDWLQITGVPQVMKEHFPFILSNFQD